MYFLVSKSIIDRVDLSYEEKIILICLARFVEDEDRISSLKLSTLSSTLRMSEEELKLYLNKLSSKKLIEKNLENSLLNSSCHENSKLKPEIKDFELPEFKKDLEKKEKSIAFEEIDFSKNNSELDEQKSGFELMKLNKEINEIEQDKREVFSKIDEKFNDINFKKKKENKNQIDEDEIRKMFEDLSSSDKKINKQYIKTQKRDINKGNLNKGNLVSNSRTRALMAYKTGNLKSSKSKEKK